MMNFEKPKYLLGAILIGVGLYALSAFRFNAEVESVVEDLLAEKLNVNMTVEQGALDGHYLIDSHRKGKALILVGETPVPMEISVYGNGLWQKTYVEIPPGSALGIMFSSFLENLLSDD
jgi:hypothetical protein